MSVDAIVIAEDGDTATAAPAFTGEVLTGSSDSLLAPQPDKPILRLSDAEFAVTCETAERILASSVYAQGSTLVRVGHAYEMSEANDATENKRSVGFDGIGRNPAQCFLLPVTKEYIERQLSRDATIEKVMADGSIKRVSCPERIALNILKHGNSPNFRPLGGIARAPFMRIDGSVCDEPGYDPRSQTLYVPNANFPELSKYVSEDDARDALGVLLDPFDQFPFASEASRAAFAAHILTEAARVALDRVPLFFYTAQYAGTGKSLLSEMPATVVHGVEPALRDWVTDEEMRKSLFASLVAGDRSIAFDNLPGSHKIRSAPLAKFVTERFATERKLGETQNLSAINLAVVSLSGNNLTPAGDLARRSLIIRLDADMPSTELKNRTFKIDGLRHYVAEHRVELMMAALTILRGYAQSDVKGPTPMPSFEKWSRVVRDALLWLGIENPLGTQMEEADDETGSLEEAFRLLAEAVAGREFMARDVTELVNQMLDLQGELGAALVKAGCSDPHSSLKAGYWLRDCRDKFGGGYKLVRITSKSKGDGTKWCFKPTDATSAGAPPADNLDLVVEG